MPKHDGKLIIISSPSGGGKDAVIRALLKIFPGSARLITTTSRAPRPGQTDGVDYHFISRAEFERKLQNGEFVEYNDYAGNLYGTERSRLNDALSAHEVVFTQIEVNGKRNFDKAGIPHLAIFLLPENLDTLRHRIEKRGGVTDTGIADRLRIADSEIKSSDLYDRRVINREGRLDQTVAEVAGLIADYAGIDKKAVLR